jgi:hypothetical protein
VVAANPKRPHSYTANADHPLHIAYCTEYSASSAALKDVPLCSPLLHHHPAVMDFVSFSIRQRAIVSAHHTLRQITSSPQKPLVIKPELLYSNTYSIASVFRQPCASSLPRLSLATIPAEWWNRPAGYEHV